MTSYRGRHRERPWVRRNPLLAAMAATIALWLPYGLADAYGLTGAWQGTSVSLLPPACPSESGGEILPCRWECNTMGNRTCGPMTPDRVIYRVAGDGSVEVCAAPVPGGMVCAALESDTPIEYVGTDGAVYRITGGE